MIFRDQPGSYPGIPGTFAHCRVELDEAGSPIVTPLDQLPHVLADVETPPEEPPAQETIVQEQAATPAPQFIGG